MIGQDSHCRCKMRMLLLSVVWAVLPAGTCWGVLAVWGKGTAAQLLPAMGRWLHVDECRHCILVFIAGKCVLSFVWVMIWCVAIELHAYRGFVWTSHLMGAEVVMMMV